jgi:hypothetical protein
MSHTGFMMELRDMLTKTWALTSFARDFTCVQ